MNDSVPTVDISIGTPTCEVEVNGEIVRRLLQEQHPDLQSLSIRQVDAGWDNAMFRLGDGLAVRLPRRQMAAPLIKHEQTWLPFLASGLTLPVPVPLRIGLPTAYYPWRWSVVPWLIGVSANRARLNGKEAERLAVFLRSLHVPAPANAPHNPFRSIPLSSRASFVEERLERLELKTNLITPGIRRLWNDAVQAPVAKTMTWIHGDLHPRNLLACEGQISGVIDWGDMAAGDAATDLATIWMLFDREQDRNLAMRCYGATGIEQRRAKGWAVFFAAVLLETGLVDNPENAAIGENTFRRLNV